MIDILTINETKSFTTKVLNIELLRTGTNSYGSCFFDSLFMPFKYFRSMTEEQKKKFIIEKRRELADTINFEEWFTLQNGNVAFLQIIENMRIIIHTIQEILQENDNKKYMQQYNINTESLNILFALLDPVTIEKEILPEWDIECSNKSGGEFLENIKSAWFAIYKKRIIRAIEDLENKLDDDTEKMDATKKQKVIQKLSLLSYPIFDFVTSRALHKFKDEISDPQRWLTVFTFMSVLQYMNLHINIIIIDYETGLPYQGMKLIHHKNEFDNDYPFVVILYFKEMHFESLGRKTVIHNKTIINRLFKKDDPFIITCISFLEK